MAAITIRDEFTPNDQIKIIERHRVLYETEYGFNAEFGDYVASSLSEPIERLWIAERDGEFIGCIGLVEADTNTGQLRWFLIEPAARGVGLGKTLMQRLLDHCRERGYERIFLWTVNKLPAARAIYERFGFKLREQKPERLLWGQNLSE
ncbi:MAG: GNAT family N-acetyltransferase, partial [Bacteroidota bacterium]|nr:GNAT family N-acetyltransferase [Bacteroidota bacterium]